MSTSLNNTKISATFPDLLQLGNSGQGLNGPPFLTVCDGDGNTSGLALAPGGMMNLLGRARVTANVVNATAAMANVSDLTLTVLAGAKYTGRLVVLCNNGTAADGIQMDFNGGTATMTSFWAMALPPQSGTLVAGTVKSTSLAGVVNWTTITGETLIVIEVSFVVNAGGTIIPRFANASGTGTLTFELGSHFWLDSSPN